MAAKIITVFNQKGGAGKTTVSMGLAGAFGLRRRKTMLVDLDDQGTATISVSQATEDKPFPATCVNLSHSTQPHLEIRKFLADYDFVVIDCPPAIKSEAPSIALLISDLGIIPVGGSGGNLWASNQAKKLGKQAQTTNPALKLRTVGNMDQNVKLIREVFEALAQDEEIPMFDTRLGYRAAYKEAEALGQAVAQFAGKRNPATREIDSLVDEVLAVIE